MNEDISKVKQLIDKINTLNFFERLFGWKRFKAGLVEVSSFLSMLPTWHLNSQAERKRVMRISRVSCWYFMR